MTASQYRVYLSLFFLALSSWFLADLFEPKEVKQAPVVDHSPDYFSSGYYKKEMTEQGLVKNELTAAKMIHYSDDGTTHLEQPVMTLYNEDAPPWIIQSDAGLLAADRDHLLLSGTVVISRAASKTLKRFTINTSDLKVQLSINYAETKKWAELIDGVNRTQGIGMKATFVSPVELEFLSKVKGRYEIN